MKFDPQKHHRRSIRLKGYDYTSAGAYFVTIIACNRDCLFGEITNEKINLSEYGKIAHECWRAIPNHFPNVEFGAYVVMPNHVHGVIIIKDDGRDTPWRVPTEQFSKPVKNSLATIIRQYKSSVSRIISKQFNETNIWQRNYHEHIIRNDNEWNNIHLYIEANPANWTEDLENPVNVKLK
jgi:putative transposase